MNNDSARGRDAAIDVENGGMQTLFALETEVAVGNLDGDGNEAPVLRGWPCEVVAVPRGRDGAAIYFGRWGSSTAVLTAPLDMQD